MLVFNKIPCRLVQLNIMLSRSSSVLTPTVTVAGVNTGYSYVALIVTAYVALSSIVSSNLLAWDPDLLDLLRCAVCCEDCKVHSN